MRSRPLRPLVLLGALALCLGLGACGRKGALEGPPGSNLAPEPKRSIRSATATTPEAPSAAPSAGAVVPPKRSFFLDPLL